MGTDMFATWPLCFSWQSFWLIMSLRKNPSTEQCGVILFIHLKEKAIDKLCISRILGIGIMHPLTQSLL